ncbi:PRC-barrel domain-containing protein [Rubrobacter naiadicus]|uniref:PRC-barrel domain-containing protein n=1 Tax=Rubrobacter naiadicus TaxID=1392641 RepID=UPI00235FF226|nr:PRC-barrel domain-containing protein [Rubrobacter naiadicus]
MEARDTIGLEARTADGTGIGRVSDVLYDEESGAATHLVVEREGESFEVPISGISLDEEADFVTLRTDRPDAEPAGRVGQEEYAPDESDEEDHPHEGQFVTEPQSEPEALSPEDLAREDWEDETYTPDSGYPRNDVYIDPDTGEEVTDPYLEDNRDLGDDVEDLLEDTELTVRSVKEGVVELSGRAASQQDLEDTIEEIMGLEGVREVDATDVEVSG